MIFGASIRLKDQFSTTLTSVSKKTNTFIGKTKVLNNTVIRPVIKVKDTATKAINRVKESLISLKGLVVTAGIGLAGGAAVSGAMTQEQQRISMEHFIGYQNKGMTPAEVKKEADEYMKWMENYANITPFSNNEVIGGGARAVNVAGGNIAQARELVKLAGDMAALNPEKTFSDAMEALADLRVGETERMKEFGFKISQDDIKAAGGVDNVINSEIIPFFKGGAEKLSASASGLWSTITGNMGTWLTKAGTGILDGLKPQLQSVVGWMDSNNDKITIWSTNIGKGIGKAITFIGDLFNAYGPIIKRTFGSIISFIQPIFQGWVTQVKAEMPNIKSALASVFEWLGPKISFVGQMIVGFQGMWLSAWPIISSVIQTAWGIIRPALDIIFDGVKIVWGIFKAAWPGIISVVKGAWSILKPIFDALGKGLGLISKGVKWVAEKFDASPKEIKVSSTGGKPKGKASGLAYVPYDNYPALLHRGETVLARAAADQYRQGKTNSNSGHTFTVIINGYNRSTDDILDELENRLIGVAANMGGA